MVCSKNSDLFKNGAIIKIDNIKHIQYKTWKVPLLAKSNKIGPKFH